MPRVREILLVDDNPADVALAREALAAHAQRIRISSVSDGEAAMTWLRRENGSASQLRPDLVVLDLNLPKKDGRAVLAEMKADPGLRQIPVVVFSTSQSGHDIAGSYALGANCFICKPGNLQEFFRAVQGIAQFWFGCVSLPREEN